MNLTLTSNAAEVIREFRRLPANIQGGINRRLKGALLVVEDKVRLRNRSTGSDSVAFTGGRSGLSSRLTSYVRGGASLGFEAAIGFRRTKGFPYELAQEFGAKAKPGKAMAIPLTPEARAAGSPRQFPGVLVIIKRSASAKAVLATVRGEKVDAQYALRKSIPPRLGFKKTVMENVGFISEEIVKGAIEGSKS